MSVLACGRKKCDNVMCDRLILERDYYICGDCFEELKTYKESWDDRVRVMDVWRLIDVFMATPVGTYDEVRLNTDKDAVDAEFKRLTELQ